VGRSYTTTEKEAERLATQTHEQGKHIYVLLLTSMYAPDIPMLHKDLLALAPNTVQAQKLCGQSFSKQLKQQACL